MHRKFDELFRVSFNGCLSASRPHATGAACPECRAPLAWPQTVPDDHLLTCPSGHVICSMRDFRQAAYEMALSEEIRLRMQSATRRQRTSG